MDNTSPHSQLKCPMMTSHATGNKIQTPNLDQHDLASAKPSNPVSFTGLGNLQSLLHFKRFVPLPSHYLHNSL